MKPLKIELTAANGEGSPKVSGVAYSGGIIRPSGWGAVVVDLAGLEIPASVPMLTDHENRVAAKLGDLTAQTDGKQLTVSGEITSESGSARGLVEQSKRGGRWQLSIGADPKEISEVEANEEIEVNGQTLQGPFMFIRRAKLREVSVVAVAADDRTSLRIAAAWNLGAKPMGDDEKKTEQKRIEAAGVKVEPPKDAPSEPPKRIEAAGGDEDPVTKYRAGIAAEQKRIAAVQAALKDHPELCAKAIGEGWGAEKAELEALRASRPQAAPHIGAGKPAPTVKALEAGLCLASGMRESRLEKEYGPEVMEAAHGLRRIGLRKTAELCAQLRGVDMPLSVDGEWMRAAFSNTDLSGILGNVANKALGTAFENVPAVAARISRAASHMNFHSHTVYSLALDGGLEEVGARGELKSMSLSEESYTRQLKTRGATLTVSRQDIINDELGAFTDMATRMGRKAAQSREQVAAKALNDTGAGSSHFTSARGNYFAGASSALSETSLGTGLQKFREMTGPQTDEDGDDELIDVDPRILLVPAALEVTARKLLAATRLISGEDKTQPDVNIWAGEFDLITWARIGTVGGGTNTNWYLFADPQDVPVMEISYLAGNQTPTIEFTNSIDNDPSTLGATWRIYWDFGIDLAEWRGGIKSKGAA